MTNGETRAASVLLSASPERCWNAFTETAMLPNWVPGLRRARVVRADPRGLPLEVAFEFGATLSYSLIYEHDVERRVVRWEPRVGRRDGVAGTASFEPVGDGCRFTYELHASSTHASRERVDDDPERLVAAFEAWLRKQA